MVNQSTIKSNTGARKGSKRVGRGNASGKGTFCGRGCNGQNSRSGNSKHHLFEGGQSPLHLRLPKLRGFKRTLKQNYVLVSLDMLEKLGDAKELTKKALVENNIIKKEDELVKVLGTGKLTKGVTIHADGASASALKAVEKAGGKIILPEAGEVKETKRVVRKQERMTKDWSAAPAKEEKVKAKKEDKKEEKKEEES